MKRQRPRAMRLLRGVLLVLLFVLGAGFVTTRVLVASAERDYPREGRLVECEGLQHHVVERGEGAPVVLVHGAFGGAGDFLATVVPELASRYRCVAWDRPGHGYSERPPGEVDPGVQADLLLALIAQLGLDRPLLVGFSYGGAVALAAGMRAGRRLRGVVMLNGPSHPWPDPLDFHYELPAVPLLGPLVVETWMMPFAQLVSGTNVRRAFAPREATPAFARSPLALALRPDSYRANAEDVRTLKPFLRRQSEDYGTLQTPVTLVVAEQDQVVSPTIHSPALHAAAPGCTMVRIPDAGHQILYTHPALVISVIDGAMR